jgi:hypothetical protein
MYVLYYASILWCWHLVWILVRTDHPCFGVGCHKHGPFTRLVGFGWVGPAGFVSSRSVSGYAAGVKPVCMV